MLIILHDLNLAAPYANRIAVLQEGKFGALGAPTVAMTPAIILENFAMPVLVTKYSQLGCPQIVPAFNKQHPE